MASKTEVGQVHYLTTRLTFPRDRDQWVRQSHIPASTAQGIFFYIGSLGISDELKRKLFSNLECSWKDRRGVWIQLVIERTKRNKKWGPSTPAERMALIRGGK